MCQAIEFAHAQGYCHLDIKPGNINVGEYGDTYMLDWGLARAVDSSGNAIAEPCAITSAGTPGYMAPEQITPEAGKIGIKSDIYALGALLYTILTYKSPAGNSERDQVFQQTLTGTFPRLSEAAPENIVIPESLEAVVIHAMAPNPADRYQSVKELRTDILAYTSGFATTAEHASVGRKTILFIQRNALLLLAGFIGFALALTIILLWTA
jgi:serine/threonine-protein kinase